MVNETLYDVNQRLSYYFIPTYVLLALIFFIGSIGNSLLLYNYYHSFKRSTHWYFVITLALYDLLICSIVAPLAFHHLYHFFMFTDARVCRLYRLAETVAIVGSMCILICIAAHTYVKICHPFYRIKIGFIKIVCWSTFLGTLIFHIPLASTLFGVSLKITPRSHIVGYNCDVAEEFRGSLVDQGYKFVLGLITVTVFTSFAVFYGLVLRKMRKQQEIFASRVHTPPIHPPLFSTEQGVTPSTQMSVIAESGATQSKGPNSPSMSLSVIPSLDLQFDSLAFAEAGKSQTLAPSENSPSMSLAASAGPKRSDKRKPSPTSSNEPIKLPTDGETALNEKQDSGTAGGRKVSPKIILDHPDFNTLKADSASQKESSTSYPPSGTCGINESTQPAPPPLEASPSHQNDQEDRDFPCPKISRDLLAPRESSDVDRNLGLDRKDSPIIQRVLDQNADIVVSPSLQLPSSTRKLKFQSGSQSSSSNKTQKRSKSHSGSCSASKSNLVSKSPHGTSGNTWFKSLFRTFVVPKLKQKDRVSHRSLRSCKYEKVAHSADSLPLDEVSTYRKTSGIRNFTCSESTADTSLVQESCVLQSDSAQDRVNPSNTHTGSSHDPNVRAPSKSDTVLDLHWNTGLQHWIQHVISSTQILTQGTDQFSTMSMTTDMYQDVSMPPGKPVVVSVESCVDLPHSSQVSISTSPSCLHSDPVDDHCNIQQPYTGTGEKGEMRYEEKNVVDSKRVASKTKYVPSVSVNRMAKPESKPEVAGKNTKAASSTKAGDTITNKEPCSKSAHKKLSNTMSRTKTATKKTSKTASRTKSADKMTKTESCAQAVDQTMKTTSDAKTVGNMTKNLSDMKAFDKMMDNVASVHTTDKSNGSITHRKADSGETGGVSGETIGRETTNVASICTIDNESKYVASLKPFDSVALTERSDYNTASMASTLDPKRIVGAKTIEAEIKSAVGRKTTDIHTKNLATRPTKTVDNDIITCVTSTQTVGRDFDSALNTPPVGSDLDTVYGKKASCVQGKHSRWNIKLSAVSYPFAFNESALSQAVGHYGCWRKIKRKFRFMDNASLSVFAISFTFVLCSFPLVALVAFDAMNSTDFVYLGVVHFTIKFAYVQNAIHPLIYLVANRKLREIVAMQFSAFFAFFFCRRRAQS